MRLAVEDFSGTEIGSTNINFPEYMEGASDKAKRAYTIIYYNLLEETQNHNQILLDNRIRRLKRDQGSREDFISENEERNPTIGEYLEELLKHIAIKSWVIVSILVAEVLEDIDRVLKFEEWLKLFWGKYWNSWVLSKTAEDSLKTLCGAYGISMVSLYEIIFDTLTLDKKVFYNLLSVVRSSGNNNNIRNNLNKGHYYYVDANIRKTTNPSHLQD